MAWSTADIGAYKAAAGGGGTTITGTITNGIASATQDSSGGLIGIVSVVPSTFLDTDTSIVITTKGITTAGAVIRINGLEQTVTGTSANTITFTAVQGSMVAGSATLEVIEA